MITTITKHLTFDSEYGLFYQSDEQKHCIANTGLYITPLFAMALMGKLSDISSKLLQTREWQQIQISTSFISYKELHHYVKLSTHPEVQKVMPENQKNSLNKLVRIFLQWVVDKEDELVQTTPHVWFEPAFYPIEISIENDDFDLYNRYDSIPIDGFARSAFYFFISNTAKNIIKSALLENDLLSACETAIEKCKRILNDKGNVEYHPGLYRKLFDTYLDWRYQQTELILAHKISLSSDDLWQHIFNEENEAYKLFEKNIDKHRLYDMRPIFDLQGDLLERIKKDHPYISTKGKAVVPTGLPKENSYPSLIQWLDDERKNGRNYLADHNNNIASMCKDPVFCKKIGWHKVNSDSLRKAINRKIKSHHKKNQTGQKTGQKP